jgi:hypothetical protein
MELYFIHICNEWYLNLYNEYIVNIILFINNKFNLKIQNLLIDEKKNYINEFNKVYNKNNKYIFTGNTECINTIFEKYRNRNFYYLNVEQMSKESYFDNVKKIDNQINIIDYSEENIPFLKSHFKKVFLIPPIYLNHNLHIIKDKNIISFSNNEYRINFLKNINSKFNVEYIDNVFGEERDNIFKRSKIYINIHSSETHKTMELIRIINLLKNNVIVLSQNSIFPELLRISKSIIIFNNIEQLEYLLDDILNNYKAYYEYIFKTTFLHYDTYVYNHIKSILF